MDGFRYYDGGGILAVFFDRKFGFHASTNYRLYYNPISPVHPKACLEEMTLGDKSALVLPNVILLSQHFIFFGSKLFGVQ